MPIGWMTALKMVPWGDVIENAPTLVNGAKKLFTKTRAEPTPDATPTTPADVSKPAVGDDQRLAQLTASLEQSHSRIATLEAESRDTAALIKSLAEQQEKVITAIDVLGKRTNVLIATCVILAVTCAGLIAALVAR